MKQNEKEAIRLLFEDIIKESHLGNESLAAISQVMENDFMEARQKRYDINNALADLYEKYHDKEPDEDFILRERLCIKSLEKYNTKMEVICLWSDAQSNIKK